MVERGSNWVICIKRADFQKISQKFGIDPVIARLVRNRDIVGDEETAEYLYGGFSDLHSPHLMLDLDKAVCLLMKKIQSKKHIRIIGDYDVDGVMSTYILLKGIERCGGIVDYDLPDRIKDGYGLNKNLIDQAYQAGTDTIVTCDNGIAALEQVAYAKNLGMTVIVTDHHSLPKDEQGNCLTPAADAVVNPHQPSCQYPYKELCGAGVAYKLIAALYEAFFIPTWESQSFIEYAGFATVGDVMDLTGENRILTRLGLNMLNRTENMGMKALIKENGLDASKIVSHHIGFVLAPCLNAGGRLDTAKRSLQLLLSKTEDETVKAAKELVILNEKRKEMTIEGYEKAVEMVDNGPLKNDRVLIVYLPKCHESLAGIIAGRLRERYYRPAIVLTDSKDGVKGSGRSIDGYSMFEEMQKAKDIFINFGGHPMAAGCSLRKEDVENLRRRLNETCTLTAEELTEKTVIDVPMPLGYISERLVGQLELMEPFGKANPKPVFAVRRLTVFRAKELGKSGRVTKLLVMDEGSTTMEAMWFGDAAAFQAKLADMFGEEEVAKCYAGKDNAIAFDATYYPEMDEWNGNRTIRIVLQDIR